MTKKVKFLVGLACVLLALSIAKTSLKGQAATPPVLLVVNSSAPNPFGPYLAEILRAEGIKSFTTVELSALNSGSIASTPLILLTETTLNASQASLFRDYVDEGGRLIAMRPDPQIADLFGLIPQASTTPNGYISINQTDTTGAGLAAMTLPFRGTASNYLQMGGASTLATLFSDRSTPTVFPAVVRFNRTAAWSFDLARSVAYARQGDPANINVDTGLVPPLQSFDLFYTGFDAQRISVPFADIQMRLLARQIADLLSDQAPLPQLWYYPSARRAMMLVAADAHSGFNDAFARMLAAAESFGARVTFFISRYMPEPTPAQAADWRARGHEIALHPYGYNDNVSLQQGFQNAFDWFTQAGLGTPGRTIRSHQIEWLGWVDAAQIAANFGMGLDLNHYSFGPAVLQPNGQQGHGYITGSGRPMRFVTPSGGLIPVYGQPTVLIDHQLFGITIWSDTLTTQEALTVSRNVIDAAVSDYHTVIPTQFHTDYYPWGEVQPWVDGTMAYAQANNLPMWTGERWLQYNEARDATNISGITWNGTSRQLQFSVTVPSGAEAQTVTVPTQYGGSQLTDVRVNSAPVSVTTQTINGRSVSMFSVAPMTGGATVVATYGPATPILSINDVSVVEGTGGTNSAVFNVTLSAGTSSTVTVNFATADGTATAPGDYTGGSGSLTFTPNLTTQLVTVPIVTDSTDEANESFTVVLANPVNATIAKGIGVGTIANDDSPQPSLSVNNVSGLEGDSGTSTVNLVVTLTPTSSQTVTVNWATSNATAIAGSDYTAASGTLTFAAGVTSQTVPLSILGDTAVEADETFNVVLSTPNGAVIGDGTGVVSIVNDDSASASGSITRTTRADFLCSVPTNTIITQGVDGEVRLAGTFGDEFTDAPLGSQWTAGAWSGGAYTPAVVGGVLTIGNANGAYVRSTDPVNVTTVEAYGQFSAAPWEHVGWAGLDFATDEWVIFSTMGTSTTLYARTNADGPEQITSLGPIPSGYRDYRVERVPQGGNTDLVRYSIDGVVVASHTVTGLPATMYLYQSQNGGATPTLNIDSIWVYPNHVLSGTLESCSLDAGTSVTWTTATWSSAIPAGTSLGVRTRTSANGTTWSAWSSPLTASGESITSPDGRYLQFALDLASTAPAVSPVVDSIAFAFGTPASSLAIGNASATEGSGNAVFTVTLSPASGQTVTVNYATTGGTATSGVDFTATIGTLTFAAGVTSQTVTVPVLNDSLNEGNETFTVTMTVPVNATLGTATGTGTINDDEASSTLAIGNAAATEGAGNVVFTVTLSPASSQTVTVNYATAGGTATSGADFTATNGTLTFLTGVTSQTVTVPVVNDTVAEPTETFTVTLTSPANAIFGTAIGTGTITDNDATPTLNFANVSVSEGVASGTAVFDVTLSAASGQTVTVNFATANGTATAGADYTAVSGTLTFPPDTTSRQITVPIINDVLDENSETFTVTLSLPVNATVPTATRTGTITDNDATPSLTFANVAVTEGDTGSVDAVFTVTLSAVSGSTVTVNFATSNGTATAGQDYTARNGTLTFAPGTTSQTISVPVLGDTLNENNETYTLTLNNAANASVPTATRTGTITDNDPLPSFSVSDVTVTEGNNGNVTATFTITLSVPSGRTASVNYATANGTAVSPADFNAVSGSLSFTAGTTSRVVNVQVRGDTAVEPNETFLLNLSGASNATIGDGQGVGTILNND